MALWAVDLYDESKMNEDMLAMLRTNRDDVSKINSDGMFLSQVITALKAKPISEQKKLLSGEKAMSDWSHRVIGMPKRSCARMLAILRNEAFMEAFEQYVALSYGQEFFQFALGEMIVNSKLDEVRLKTNDCNN
jgi:hypothetical protein